MAEVKFWEKRFIDEYIVPEKRDRYLMKLKGPKHRQEILNRLNHLLDYRREKATPLSAQERTTIGLLHLLRSHHVADTCHIVADANPYDGKELRLELAVEELLGNAFGCVPVCPPVPIAVYKQEDIGNMYFLRPTKT